MKRFTIAFIPFLFAVTALLAETPQSSKTQPPNVVFILVDDWGWTDAGCYGSDFYETPQIDRLAMDGVRFTQAYSACTVCSPSRAAILTGKYPARLHLTDWIPGYQPPESLLLSPEWNKGLELSEYTIAEEFKSRGYTTGIVGKWHLGGDKFKPELQGFDFNFAGCHVGSPRSFFPPYGLPVKIDEKPGEMLTDRLTREAIGFIEAHQQQPFFLYLSYYAVHIPVAGKPEIVDKYKKKLMNGSYHHTNPEYAAMLQTVDENLGKIRETLKQLGISDRTVLILASDNGGFIGRKDVKPSTSNAPLRAGKGSAYSGGVRVPLIVRWPGVTPTEGVCETPVKGVDFYPTLLEIVDGAYEPRPDIDGTSFALWLRNPENSLRGPVFWHYPHYHPGGATPYSAVRYGDWKLIHFYEDGRYELYNLAEDIGESHDLAVARPKIVQELRAMLEDWLEREDAQFPRRREDPS